LGKNNMSEVFRCEQLLVSASAKPQDDMAILVAGGMIQSVIKFSDFDLRDYPGKVTRLPGLTMPGLIDAHSHLRSKPAVRQASLLGLELEQWVYALGGLTQLPLLEDTRLAAHELLATGVTSVQVLSHSWQGLSDRLVEVQETIQALNEAGLRALLILGFTDQAEFTPLPCPDSLSDFPEPERGLDVADWPEFIAAADALITALGGLVSIGVGPVAPQWCSDEALQSIALHRDRRRVHTHLHESPAQRTWLGNEEAPIERLQRAGLLGEFSSAAHGVDLNDAEFGRIAEAGATLVHCPVSNTCLSVGKANVNEWQRRKLHIALGMDSQTLPRPDMFAEMRAARVVAKARGHDLSAIDVLHFATIGGAHALGIAAGEIVTGKLADFISLKQAVLTSATRTTSKFFAVSAAERILEEVCSADVQSVVIDGQLRWPVNAERSRQLDRVEFFLESMVRADAGARDKRMAKRRILLDRLALVQGGVR
jgi:5-methylthioadenosine/S-adenosylhomocysteine deaminase